MTMPRQKPGKSRQVWSTPWPFLDAVERRFGPITFDLAADLTNCRVRSFDAAKLLGGGQAVLPRAFAKCYYGPSSEFGVDALAQDWRQLSGNLWLNPEYADIGPWAKKCSESAAYDSRMKRAPARRIFFLVPASVGSEWFAEYVFDAAHVIFPRPRLSFDGKAPYPKDTCLAVYGEKPGVSLWRWDR